MMKFKLSKLLAGNGRQLFIYLAVLCCSMTANASSMTADHSQFEQLQKSFKDVESIQQTCVDCHNQAELQLHDTVHWQWTYPLDGDASETDSDTGTETGTLLGKLNVINGYHPNVASNASACGSCHIGFGLSSRTKQEIPEEPVDCLICHDTSGEYAYNKFHQDGAECSMCHDDGGEANKKRVKAEGKTFSLNLTEIAQSVGATSNQSCGSCHFYDGGSDGAKHGDLDSALVSAAFEMDVHMSPDGANLTCSDCHQAAAHELAGSRYEAASPTDMAKVSALEGPRATCQSCHGDSPMHDDKLNDHTDVIACQTCHIPEYARNGIATKTSWDWSTAGKLDRKRRPFAKYDDNERVAYSSGKGDMTYGENLTPVYKWHNGQLDYQTTGAAINPDGVTPLNASLAERNDPAKIFPFHVFNSRLPYDVESNQLLPINLAGRSRSALWNGYKWDGALKQGARAAGIKYSGEHDFADVETIRALNHTVAPKEQALDCESCHAPDGLMSELTDVYVPGATPHSWLDQLGVIALIASLLGVFLHGFLRWFFAMRRKRS